MINRFGELAGGHRLVGPQYLEDLQLGIGNGIDCGRHGFRGNAASIDVMSTDYRHDVQEMQGIVLEKFEAGMSLRLAAEHSKRP
jgi:hypothetical protein